jgi:hypothetical protein
VRVGNTFAFPALHFSGASLLFEREQVTADQLGEPSTHLDGSSHVFAPPFALFPACAVLLSHQTTCLTLLRRIC